MTVQGGGKLTIETEGQGMTLEGETFIVESGGIIEVDKLTLRADTLTVEDSAEISANQKVIIFGQVIQNMLLAKLTRAQLFKASLA